MAIRVIGIPDRDGIIRISCGGEVIEIQVAPAGGGGSGGGTSATPGGPRAPDPFGPFAGVVGDIMRNPFDLPGAYITPPRTALGKTDLGHLMGTVERQFADPHTPNPRVVVLNVAEANLHEIGALGRELSKTHADLPLAIDFGGLLKR